VAGSADIPPLPAILYDEWDADYDNNNLSDWCGAKGKAPMSLKQMEFSLMQYAKRMGQPNFSTFNGWKKVWVAGVLEKKHRAIIQGQDGLKQVQDEPLNWEMAVADFLVTSGKSLPLENFDNA